MGLVFENVPTYIIIILCSFVQYHVPNFVIFQNLIRIYYVFQFFFFFKARIRFLCEEAARDENVDYVKK